MKILEKACPECEGNVVVGLEEGSLVCEKCEHTERTRSKRDLALALEEAVEYGPLEKRLQPSQVGRLFLHPGEALSAYLRETLLEATRGLDLEDYDMDMLRKWGLLEERRDDTV